MKEVIILMVAIAAGAYITYKRFEHKFVPPQLSGRSGSNKRTQ